MTFANFYFLFCFSDIWCCFKHNPPDCQCQYIIDFLAVYRDCRYCLGKRLLTHFAIFVNLCDRRHKNTEEWCVRDKYSINGRIFVSFTWNKGKRDSYVKEKYWNGCARRIKSGLKQIQPNTPHSPNKQKRWSICTPFWKVKELCGEDFRKNM